MVVPAVTSCSGGGCNLYWWRWCVCTCICKNACFHSGKKYMKLHTGSLKLGKLSISPSDCIMTCRHTGSHTSGGNHLLVTDNEVICLPRICSYIDEKYGFRGFSQLMKINRRYVFLQMDKLLRNVAFCKPNLKMKFDFILLMKLLTNMNIERARYFFFNGFHKFDMSGLTYLKSLSIWIKINYYHNANCTFNHYS